MAEVIPEFGIPTPGADYRLRPGGYVILLRDGAIGVVSAPAGLVLPGGGQEDGETAEVAAVRETAEECGLRVELGERIGVADELVFAADERLHFRKRCTFFLARVVGHCEGGESDHVLTRLPAQEAAARLRFGSQRWAVAEAGRPRGSDLDSRLYGQEQTMPTNTVRFHRVLKAAPEKVYRAFLDADAMVKWLPPNGFTGKVHHLDARVGGTYRMSFTNFGTGSSHSFGGEFLELVPGECIRHTDKFDDANLPGTMQTTITLRKVFCGTELTVVQEGIPEVIPAEACCLGWQESLVLLAKLVEAEIPD